MSDALRMDYINNLPQPFMVRFCGDSWWWPVHDLEVGTALMRIDVYGLLEVRSFGEVAEIKSIDGDEYDPESFWSDYEGETAMINEWQPIETAPKDGTVILIYQGTTRHDGTISHTIYVCQWTDHFTEHAWTEAGGEMYSSFYPTHWMPLPPPPPLDPPRKVCDIPHSRDDGDG